MDWESQVYETAVRELASRLLDRLHGRQRMNHNTSLHHPDYLTKLKAELRWGVYGVVADDVKRITKELLDECVRGPV